MRYIGVDPGAEFTGLAVLQAERFTFWAHSADPCAIWEIVFQNAVDHKVTVLVEDFTGSGPRNAYNKQTIEVLGYIFNSCRGHNLPVVRVHNQARLSCVHLVPPYIHQKDEIAAAAHVLAYLERMKL